MTEQELEFQVKVKLVAKEVQLEIYTYSSRSKITVYFKDQRNTYFFELPITFTDAALGTSVEVPSIDGGKAKVKIPPGTQHGKQLRLKGKGMPLLRGTGFGDLYIKIITEVPLNLKFKTKKNY